MALLCFGACLHLSRALAEARRAGREALIRLSAEQSQHEVSKTALRDAGAELAMLRDKLAAAQKRAPSVECQEMLADLMSGGALLHVTRLNPNDVFLQSPRAMR